MQETPNSECKAARPVTKDRALQRLVSAVSGPALRLHHLRMIHSRMLNEALRAHDRRVCRPRADSDEGCAR
jgi:hypothetical protein